MQSEKSTVVFEYFPSDVNCSPQQEHSLFSVDRSLLQWLDHVSGMIWICHSWSRINSKWFSFPQCRSKLYLLFSPYADKLLFVSVQCVSVQTMCECENIPASGVQKSSNTRELGPVELVGQSWWQVEEGFLKERNNKVVIIRWSLVLCWWWEYLQHKLVLHLSVFLSLWHLKKMTHVWLSPENPQ